MLDYAHVAIHSNNLPVVKWLFNIYFKDEEKIKLKLSLNELKLSKMFS